MFVPIHNEIVLPCGKVTIVSPEDWSRVSDMKWSDNGAGYARARWGARNGGDGRIVLLHRFVMGAPKGSTVDHINGNTLDNRRENLQFITTSRNCMKARRQEDAGISFDSKRGAWRLRLRIDGNLKTLGWYSSKEKARIALAMAKDIIWSDELNPERYQR